ncbi:MAG TPA: ABC transporter permease [Casimicrobiaceae bacterium]|nr:ABC transporter permease [Casimicrobiaceae bacterium]
MNHAAAGAASIVLEGRITAYTAGPVWQAALDTLANNPDRPVVVDASRVEYIDDVGIALLFDLVRQERPQGAKVEVHDLEPRFAALVGAYDPKDFVQPPKVRRHIGIFEHMGRATAQQLAYGEAMLVFLEDCAAAAWSTFRGRGTARWSEVLDIATEAGANAVPIVLLIGFLMGVIIAFEIGLVAQQFGAVIFVVNGVGVAMLRELGPLMTAIVFAGRTGAAFAAQIGTQKVNEEVNAITTFGLSPVQFLVLPRLIAATLMVPLLAVLADVVGIFGGALVMVGFGVSFVQFYNQLLGAVTLTDFVLGVVKAAVYGLAIAAIGCERGLATGAGATSVGLSTTSAVVTSIVMIVVIDGIFTIFTS